MYSYRVSDKRYKALILGQKQEKNAFVKTLLYGIKEAAHMLLEIKYAGSLWKNHGSIEISLVFSFSYNQGP